MLHTRFFFNPFLHDVKGKTHISDLAMVLPMLTEKEQLVLTTAINSGYYEYPRKISATELAEKLGYSKSTVVEYLRKAENKIITMVCTGDL